MVPAAVYAVAAGTCFDMSVAAAIGVNCADSGAIIRVLAVLGSCAQQGIDVFLQLFYSSSLL